MSCSLQASGCYHHHSEQLANFFFVCILTILLKFENGNGWNSPNHTRPLRYPVWGLWRNSSSPKGYENECIVIKLLRLPLTPEDIGCKRPAFYRKRDLSCCCLRTWGFLSEPCSLCWGPHCSSIALQPPPLCSEAQVFIEWSIFGFLSAWKLGVMEAAGSFLSCCVWQKALFPLHSSESVSQGL